MTTTIQTVSELTQAIKMCLESTFRHVTVQGEISNCKYQSSGHLYFSLKDSHSQISVVMFRGDLKTVPSSLKDGSQVIIEGEINVYPVTGKVQIIARIIRLVGIGELLLQLEELKRALHKRGWFRKEHKKDLPKFPKTIGVVTSPTGAVIQDILNVLTRRFSGFHLILNPVKVQGEGASLEIAQAIRQFNQYKLADVLIVGRGGGSIEDLFAFNEEVVAQAIFESKIPIISAVGHETDHCIADYVADVRAPTPSAAAEIVIAEKAHQQDRLEEIRKKLTSLIQQQIKHYRLQLSGVTKQPLFQSPYTLLGPSMQKLDAIRNSIDGLIHQSLQHWNILLQAKHNQLASLNPKTRLLFFKENLSNWNTGIHQAFLSNLALKRARLQRIQETLNAINPKRLLSKGYTILFQEKENSVITSVKEMKIGQKVRLQLADGQALSTVDQLL